MACNGLPKNSTYDSKTCAAVEAKAVRYSVFGLDVNSIFICEAIRAYSRNAQLPET